MKTAFGTACLVRNKKDFRKRLAVKLVQRKKYQTALWSKQKNQIQSGSNPHQRKCENGEKSVKDEDLRIQICDDNYCWINHMHRYISQRLEMLEKSIKKEAENHVVEE